MKVKQWVPILGLILGLLPVALAEEPGTKYYVQVIKAINTEKPPGPNAKLIGSKLGDRLSPVFRWKSYWEIKCLEVVVKPDETKRVQLSSKRDLELQALSADKMEIRLFREGKLARKTCHRLHDKMMAILGGDEGKEEAWFIVVRREPPEYKLAKQ